MNILQYLLKNLRRYENRELRKQGEVEGEVEGPSDEDPAPSSTSSKSANEAKNLIEQRYRRIHTSERRPSLEYIPSEDILHVFLNFVEDKDALLRMTPCELQLLFDKWYIQVYLTQK